ncbi:exosortase-associated EpsI family protein [Candidatus Uabimicrobium amorphum]|uniref:Methanolan biosynthesis EpsI domain-containing protein n=1 Tax=Uabimicrobium amorphum TaxID=2596890 RepID=A0A5S9IUM3_UABAM|nr:exosortase-associated EpsI family protein [Candidatus Uabimicrobium amorphum]BBM86895.1 hypothetical protein UABAM_05297 [Candidatus Uabimicrobium amorphum]
MKNIKRLFAFIFIALSLFTWLRDTSWFTSLEDTIPLLMSFALFMWLSKPWETSDVVHKPSSVVAVVGCVFFTSAFVLNSTLLFACCTCCIAWLWFDVFCEGKTKHLIVFLFLSFPWIALSAEQLGWIFRVSGATFAYEFFTALGFPAEQQGTSLIISGVFLSVDSACAGMNTLQAVLVMGFAVMYLYLEDKINIALNLFLLTLLAWWTNALRIVVIGFAALAAGEEFALGLFHTWGSMILLVFMFFFTFLLAHLQQKWAKFCSEKVVVVVAFVYILLNLGELCSSWWRSPLEKYGWLVVGVWLVPCIYHLYKNRQLRCNFLLLSVAILCTFLGCVGDLNTLCYIGFACFVYSLMTKINATTLLWAVSGVVWMPAFSWLISYYITNHILLPKLCIVSITSIFAIRSREQSVSISLKLSQLAAAYAIFFILAFIWPFLPHREQQRLFDIPKKGFGFVSQDIALTDREQRSFGKANALKRFYKVGKQEFILLAIDGTKDRHAVHDPHYCIVGAGWKIISARKISHRGGDLNFVKLQRGQQTKEVVYWFAAELSTYTSPTRYWYETTMRRMTLGYLYQEPVLVILQTVNSKPLKWNKIFDLMPQILEF